MGKHGTEQRDPQLDMGRAVLFASQKYKTQKRLDLSLVVPTRNEAGNIEPLLKRVEQAMQGIPMEVIFVDDSTDDTAEVIKHLMEQFSLCITLIVRPPTLRKSGLGGAVVEGLRVAQAPWVCVMDADLQHPPELIPKILKQAEAGVADIIVGSRLAPGGDASSLGLRRSLISRLFALVTRTAFPMRLRKVTDPLSGFFILRRGAIDLDLLRPSGFKILLEIVVRFPALDIAEMPIQFGYRQSGESKASLLETIRFFRLLLNLRLSADRNLIRFIFVGASGLLVNSLVLAITTELVGLHYLWSAAVATQVSTLWNFTLTETWVFGKRQTNRLLFKRLLSFVLMNNLLLLLRAPILSFMVSYLGINYLISNLVSLFAMTLIRFLISDQLIWAKAKPARPTPVQAKYRRITQMENKQVMSPSVVSEGQRLNGEPFAFFYNIHDIIQVASMYQLPELEYFKVEELSREPDIRLRLERRRRERRRKDRGLPPNKSIDQRRSNRSRRSDNDIHYAESLGRLGFEISIAHKDCVEVAVSPILKYSLHVLYTNVIEPILRWALVRKGFALVHAACVSVGDQAVLVTARTDTGKTSTILRAVENFACSFLSDDMTILSRTGMVMSYPKPLTISNHTLTSVNGHATLSLAEKFALQFQSRLHSRTGRGVGMKLSQTKLPAATMNTVVQMLIPPPKYMIHRLLPKVEYINKASLSSAVIIERGAEFEESLSHDQSVKEFVRNAEDAYGFPPYPVLANLLSTWNEVDLHTEEQEIVSDALERVSVTRLTDPKFNWYRRLPVIADYSQGKVGGFVAADD